jgi:hypothetical protein
MISNKYDLDEFFEAIRGRSEDDAVYLASEEATQVERFLVKRQLKNLGSPSKYDVYSDALKQFIVYTNSAVRTSKCDEPAFKLYTSYIQSIGKDH